MYSLERYVKKVYFRNVSDVSFISTQAVQINTVISELAYLEACIISLKENTKFWQNKKNLPPYYLEMVKRWKSEKLATLLKNEKKKKTS